MSVRSDADHYSRNLNARTIQIILVCLYATPKVAWTGIENLYSVFLRPEKNLASLGVFHPYERLVEVRRKIF